MKTLLAFLFLLLTGQFLLGQSDSTETKLDKLSFTGDFRFRIEEDWNSRRSDGSFRTDRTRLRYRARFGFNYQHTEVSNFGIRLRTGNPIKQQDPQMTLGDGSEEFGNVPISFEKLYYQARKDGYTLWLGKNTFPFRKMNELFWSDNVYPEGVFASKQFQAGSDIINSIELSAGHFISNANGGSLDKDAYFQGFQILLRSKDEKVELFPSLYLFRGIADIPDGGGTYTLDYSIFHTGISYRVIDKPRLALEGDLYYNFEDLVDNDSIPNNLNDQVLGFVGAIVLGDLKSKGSWKFKVAYTYQERYSAVDIFAQNDWARWDYSSDGSLDGRLTNYQGLEIMAGYALSERLALNARYFNVEQLVAYGPFKENGSRIRFDLDIKF